MTNFVNDIDTAALKETIKAVAADPAKGMMAFTVNSKWDGQFRSEARPGDIVLGGQNLHRDFLIEADEPEELLGKNSGANPQEILMAAMNACMIVGYVSQAAMMGVTLTKLEIKTEGELDLRGFLGIDPSIKPGYETINYAVVIAGNGTVEQFEEMHENVNRLSPNRYNVAMPIYLTSTLAVE